MYHLPAVRREDNPPETRSTLAGARSNRPTETVVSSSHRRCPTWLRPLKLGRRQRPRDTWPARGKVRHDRHFLSRRGLTCVWVDWVASRYRRRDFLITTPLDPEAAFVKPQITGRAGVGPSLAFVAPKQGKKSVAGAREASESSTLIRH